MKHTLNTVLCLTHFLFISLAIGFSREPTTVALKDADQAKKLRTITEKDSHVLNDLDGIRMWLRVADDSYHNPFVSRDPRVRVSIAKEFGGTLSTEAAVAGGLDWLHSHQHPNGMWEIKRFNHNQECTCNGTGNDPSRVAATAMALMAFLHAGQTHRYGHYKETVERGLTWLVGQQKEDGGLYSDRGNSLMYGHGMAAAVICEALAMTCDPRLREPAQRSISFILQAQYNDGGWRYRPGPPTMRGDTSVTGWQIYALAAARAARLNVPAKSLAKSSAFLDSVKYDHENPSMMFAPFLYLYMKGVGKTGDYDRFSATTAEALCCRLSLNWKTTNEFVTGGVRCLLLECPPDDKRRSIYYWFHATKLMRRVGGDSWNEWYRSVSEILIELQDKTGHSAGSWTSSTGPRSFEWGRQGGRLYLTAFATCILAGPYMEMHEGAESR